MNTQVDLNNCDQEPIHIPGFIQPHGILIAFQEDELNITHISQNTDDILGINAEDILDQQISLLLTKKQINLIKRNLSEPAEKINPLNLYIDTNKGRRYFDGIIHKLDNLVILDLELVPQNNQNDFLSFYQLVQPIICKMQKFRYLDELYQVAVQEIRKMTGFDRVMIYKFDAEGAGEVLAEDKLESLSSFIGLHYPASDIPKQAKRLYTLNSLRLIPDVNYSPAKLMQVNNSFNNSPLDLSGSVLRSVSPIHIEYLKNMGVDASMSISLIRDKKLWGLIACHNYQSPKYVTYKLRTACELLGRIMCLEISSKEENKYLDDKIRLKEILSNLFKDITQQDAWIKALSQNRHDLLGLFDAEGVAICDSENIIMIGKTPIIDEIKNIRNFLRDCIFNQPGYNYCYAVDSFSKIYPAAEKFKNIVSGLLAIMISQEYDQYILWFRPEVIQIVNWAGDPNKPVDINPDGSMRLSPRKSFELWKEIVKLKSLPWKPYEMEIAKELRNIIVGLVLQKAEAIAKIHQQLMLALKSAKMGVWDWDLLENRIVWSIGHNYLFGLVEEDIIDNYEALKDLIDPRDRKSLDLAIDCALLEQKDYYQEFRVVWPDGSIHWIEGRGKFFLNDAGQAVRFLGTMVEVSDRKLTETKLQELNIDLEKRVQKRTLELQNSQASLQLQVERERMFISLSQQIRQSLNLQQILNTAVTELQKLLVVDRVIIYQITPKSRDYIVAEAVSNPDFSIINQFHPINVIPPECYQHYLNGQVTILNNCQDQEVIPCWMNNLGEIPVKAQLVVPIVQENHLWGLLITHKSSNNGEWEAWQIDLFQQITNQIAIAIQQSELYQQLEKELLERQQVETALRRSENLFRSLNEFAPVGIFKTDTQGQILYSNPCCQRICGFTLEKSLGNGWINFIHPEDLNIFLPQWKAGVEAHQQLCIEVRFLHEDGTIRICQIVAVPMFSEANQFMGYVGTIEDITDARNMEKMKNEFISIVSHELRTPLTSIRGCLGLLTANTIRSQPEKMQKILEIASSDTERLTRLLNDILDLERLETNNFILHQQWCNAMTLINQAVDSMQTIAQSNNMSLQVLPNSFQIWVDADRIIQTLVNLISNAIKFSPPNTTIKLGIEETSDSYLFKIQDQGRGIPNDKLESIFGKFQQIDASDSRKKGGTGLGLAICRNIIQQHGGKIWAESVLDQGSTFYFSIPKVN
ncbi:MAG TPA: GAF domain-containing protein [Nostocaceae cyanobacterium]|nr:GAF domain-containing protein [Nostocaceae cyanobacterium]